VTTADSCIH